MISVMLGSTSLSISYIVKDSYEIILVRCDSELRHDVLICSFVHDSGI